MRFWIPSRYLTAATLLAMLMACGDYSVSLPGGYKLVRVYAGAVLISHSAKGIVVDANIDLYDVLDGIIVGHVSVAELPPEKDFSKPGYFILNTKTDEVDQGLEIDFWREKLALLVGTRKPELRRPSRFDVDY